MTCFPLSSLVPTTLPPNFFDNHHHQRPLCDGDLLLLNHIISLGRPYFSIYPTAGGNFFLEAQYIESKFEDFSYVMSIKETKKCGLVLYRGGAKQYFELVIFLSCANERSRLQSKENTDWTECNQPTINITAFDVIYPPLDPTVCNTQSVSLASPRCNVICRHCRYCVSKNLGAEREDLGGYVDVVGCKMGGQFLILFCMGDFCYDGMETEMDGEWEGLEMKKREMGTGHGKRRYISYRIRNLC